MNKKKFQTEYGLLIICIEPTQKRGYKTVFKLILSEAPEFGLLAELGEPKTTIDWEAYSRNKRRQRRAFNRLMKTGKAQNLAKTMKLYTEELMSRDDKTAD